MPEWPEAHEAAVAAEASALGDPRVACFQARRALEIVVGWMYEYDQKLILPYHTELSALINEPSYINQVGNTVFYKAKLVKDMGNHAAHETNKLSIDNSVYAVKELHHICYNFVKRYKTKGVPSESVFDESLLPPASQSPQISQKEIEELSAKLDERGEKLLEVASKNAEMSEELKLLRAQVAQTVAVNAAVPDTHDYDEQTTRDKLIDEYLKEAGWPLDQDRDTEYEVSGMPNSQGKGFVDYVLWGDDGKPLGLVEAKRTRRDPREGQQQAKLYADCLEAQFGQRPVIFYSNGYEHWLWDDQMYPPRRVSGFYKKDELDLLRQRRSSRKELASTQISEKIVNRSYQTRAIRNIGTSFEDDNGRKALLVMATGSGKTRTVIALSDLLMRCNWAKRILFLADRIALVNQSVGAFKAHLPDATVVNLIEDKETDGRVFVSTYPTMMGLIDESRDGTRRFGPGHFDLIVIDEAHRSVFQKYRSILDYFDSLLVGLTATPKEDIDHNTYGLFDLEVGIPTDAYPLDEAVQDGYLVPMEAVSVPTYFMREGIKYEDLSEDEKDRWDELEWDDQGNVPDGVSAAEMNRTLFNEDTVDKVLEYLMTKGQKVAGGDRLGRTIIFAKNQNHADFIQERFDVNYPAEKGAFARTITYRTEYVQSLIDDFSFSDPPKPPHIAISVDMLDTGIDIPEVVNLVFFKPIRSKTKFWQMVGRGTRLCPDLFAPGEDKQSFYVFDFCGNLEFFGAEPATNEGTQVVPLSKKLFDARLELVASLDPAGGIGEVDDDHEPESDAELRGSLLSTLHSEVAAMNVDNFIVRAKRKPVEKFASKTAWESIGPKEIQELVADVSGLPSDLAKDQEESKRFDHLILRLQLAGGNDEGTLKKRLKDICALLAEKASVPVVKKHIELIDEIQSDDWWQDVNLPMLESVRRRLRNLVRLIDRTQKKIVYTDFEDIIDVGKVIDMPGLSSANEFTLFRQKARSFLRDHSDLPVVYKLRMNIQLDDADIDELHNALLEIGGKEDIDKASDESAGLGVFARSLVGLNRKAASDALSEFTSGNTLTAPQITFVQMIVGHLSEHGIIGSKNFYDPPFTDVAPQGPRGLFTEAEYESLIGLLEDISNSSLTPTI